MANSDISGQITDKSGTAIEGAKVYLWREDLAGAGGVVISTTADTDGNFTFTSHPDGSGSSESWHVAAKDPNANVQLKSTYGVTASTPTSIDSQFDVSITGTDGPVKPGNTVTVNASLTNSDTDTDTQTITLDIDSGVGQVDSSLEAAQGGESKSVALSWEVPSGQTAQDYLATVSSADDSTTEIVTVGSAPPSLVSHWTFDTADTNSGTAVDVVGSNDGTINGATTGVSGANQTYTTNEAYSFDGVDDSVKVSGTPDFSGGAFTLAAWVRPDELNDLTGIIGQDDFGDNPRNQRVMTNNGGIETRVYNGSSNRTAVIPSSKLSTGNWYHITGVFNHTTGETKIYLNGSLEDTQSVNSTQQSLTDIQIGDFDGAPNYYTGRIDDVRLYSKELTSTEVSNLYYNGVITDSSAYPEVVFDFETGDTSRWDTASDLSATSDPPPFNSGSFIGRVDTGSADTVATVIPQNTSGGAQISTFEFYWREPSTRTGGGIRLRNSNGNVELSTVTDNPQWDVQDANGITQVNDGNFDYNDWTRFTVTFDWSAGTFDIDFENLSTGLQEKRFDLPLIHGIDIEEVEVTNYNSRSFSPSTGIEMDFDDIRITL